MTIEPKITYKLTQNVFMIIFCIVLSSYAQTELSLQQKKDIVEKLISVCYNERNLALIDELVSVDYIEYTNGIRADSAIAIKKTIQWLSDRAPDFKIAPIYIIGENDRIAMQWVYKGTNVKYDKEVILHGIYIALFENGLIKEGWQYFDNHQRYEQLGFKMEVP